METCKKKQAQETPHVIFRILHTSGKFYVTGGTRLAGIKAQHLSRLRAGTHGSPEMQEDWNRTGEEAFSFEVLWTGLMTRKAFTRELRSQVRKLQPEYNAPLTAKGALISVARDQQTRNLGRDLRGPLERAGSALPREVLDILERKVLLDVADERWPKIVAWATQYWVEICAWDDGARSLV